MRTGGDGREETEGATIGDDAAISDSVPLRSTRTTYWRKIFQEKTSEYHVSNIQFWFVFSLLSYCFLPFFLSSCFRINLKIRILISLIF
jgi:hypothetical protein